MKRSTLTIAIAIAAVTLVGCGSDSADDTAAVDTTVQVSSEAPADTASASAPFNDVDVRFAQGGLGHHAQAVELAEIALDPKAGAGPDVLELAKAITAPSPEFDAIAALLTTWGQPLEMSKEEMAKMEGMATPETVDELANQTGTAFDTMFLTILVAHHEGAVKMAETELAEGSSPELKEIAQKLLEMRQSELVLIKGLLAG